MSPTRAKSLFLSEKGEPLLLSHQTNMIYDDAAMAVDQGQKGGLHFLKIRKQNSKGANRTALTPHN